MVDPGRSAWVARHGGFMGVGAYVTALLWNHLGVSPWIGIPISMVAAGVLALVVAYPCFRFRITGHYFVLVTLALSGIVLQVITATRDYTGGSLGYTPNRAPSGKGLLALQFDDKTTWYLIALGVWVLGLLVWRWVDRSMSRYAMEAISEDEDAAAAAGVNVTAEKLKITLISALMTALAGALYCQYQMSAPRHGSASRCRCRWVFRMSRPYFSLADGAPHHHHSSPSWLGFAPGCGWQLFYGSAGVHISFPGHFGSVLDRLKTNQALRRNDQKSSKRYG